MTKARAILRARSHSYIAAPVRGPIRPSASVLLVVALSVGAWLLLNDWLAGAGVLVLWAIWYYLPSPEGPPVLALALTFQWIQVSCGLYYSALTASPLQVIDFSDYRPMILIGLGSIVSLLLGLLAGVSLVSRDSPPGKLGPSFALSWRSLLGAYVVSTALNGVIQEAAWLVPGLTQGILAVSLIRLGLLFLIFRRVSRPNFQWRWVVGLFVFEVLLGFTGYFAGFREPLMMATLAFLEVFEPGRIRHWVVAGGLSAVLLATSVLWMGIRTPYRQDFEYEDFAASRSARLQRVVSLSTDRFRGGLGDLSADLDFLVDRLWAIYYPALAISRVPSIVPHEDGAILWAAIRHLTTPRLLFPEKPALPSDSEMVRKYSGVMVAGEEEGTSIAFGYVAESYVDFGLPLMFVPVFAYGLLMGMAYPWCLRIVRHRELAVGMATVVFWLSLYLFERSWVKTLGLSATLLIYLGGSTMLLDRMLLQRRPREKALLHGLRS